MKPQFEMDSWGREIYPVHNVLIRLDTAVWVDLRTLEAMAAKYQTPHFVYRDVKDLSGLKEDAVEKLRSLHFTTIPHTGLVVAFVPQQGAAAAERAYPQQHKEAVSFPCYGLHVRAKAAASGKGAGA